MYTHIYCRSVDSYVNFPGWSSTPHVQDESHFGPPCDYQNIATPSSSSGGCCRRFSLCRSLFFFHVKLGHEKTARNFSDDRLVPNSMLPLCFWHHNLLDSEKSKVINFETRQRRLHRSYLPSTIFYHVGCQLRNRLFEQLKGLAKTMIQDGLRQDAFS